VEEQAEDGDDKEKDNDPTDEGWLRWYFLPLSVNLIQVSLSLTRLFLLLVYHIFSHC